MEEKLDPEDICIHWLKCSVISGNLPVLFSKANNTEFGVNCSWPRYCVLKWVSVEHWSRERLRGSTVRSVGETVCPSTTTPSPSHICRRIAEFLGILVVKRLVSLWLYLIYLIIQSALGDLRLLLKDRPSLWNTWMYPDSGSMCICWAPATCQPLC